MKKKPNVIYVLADDMGYGDFSAFNREGPITPTLDRMVQEGVTLSNCYAASPVCAPARAAILTGRYPQRTGVIDTLEVRGYDRLKPSEVTLANIFRENGYHTALIGKWHLGAIDPMYHPNNRGFEYFFGFRGGWNDYYNYHVERNGIPVPCVGRYLTEAFSDEAVQYVKMHKRELFFLHLTYNAPHFPLQAPEEVIEKYRRMNRFTPAVCKLYAMIEVMDQGLGRLLAELDRQGLAENTIVVFASDNGPDFGGKGDDCQVRFNCDLRGEKMMVFEGGIKVPAVVRYPGELPANARMDAVVHGTDWLPTLLSLCGIALPEKISVDGMDVSGALRGEPSVERTLFWQWNRYKPALGCNAAMREGDYKLVNEPVRSYLDLPDWEVDMDVEIKYHPERYKDVTTREVPYLPPLKEPTPMLFDLGKDPLERVSLFAKEPEKVRKMAGRLEEWFNEMEKERLK
ncbi:MAG: sulfatase-like hydrolase/transferase [Clostridia bacterium]